MSNEILNIMAGLFIMFVMVLALGGLVNDYLQSVSDSDDSEPSPVIVFTPDDDNNDWQKDENKKLSSRSDRYLSHSSRHTQVPATGMPS